MPKHVVEIYFHGLDKFYAECTVCGWRGAVTDNIYDAYNARTNHEHRTSSGFLGLRALRMLLRAWRYGYHKCTCRGVGCEACWGLGFVANKGHAKFRIACEDRD